MLKQLINSNVFALHSVQIAKQPDNRTKIPSGFFSRITPLVDRNPHKIYKLLKTAFP